MNSDVGSFIQLTTDGGYIVGGGTGSFGIGGVYLVKLDSIGDTLWAKTYGGTGNESLNHIEQSFEGGYILLGETTSFGEGSTDIYLIRLDVNGDTLWTKTYGGIWDDYGNYIQQTADSGYFVLGATNSFGAGLSDMYLLRIDMNGDIVWTRTFGKIDSLSSDGGVSAVRTFDDGYILVGTTFTFGGGENSLVYTVKTDINGDILWSKTYGGTNDDNGNYILQTSNNRYIILGTTFSSGIGGVYLIGIDDYGDTLWTKVYDNNAGLTSRAMATCSDGGYIITGTISGIGSNLWDIFLIRIDTTGDTLWTMQYDNDVWDEAYSVEQTLDGGFVVTGFTGGPTQSSRDVYVIKTDVGGNTGCGNQKRMGLTLGSTNTVVSSTNIVVGSGGAAGGTNTTVSNTNTVESTLCFDTITGTDQKSEMLKENCSLEIFPNPVQEIVYFKNIPASKKMTLFISNILGQVIYQAELTERSINTAFMRSGIYFLNLQTDDTSFKAKLVKK